MSRLWKGLATLAVAVTACFIVAGTWLYFYTADLPPISQLEQFNPVVESAVQMRQCGGSEVVVTVVPYDQLGRYLIGAVSAAEGEPDRRNPLRATVADFAEEHSDEQHGYGRYAWQLARTLVCDGHPLERTLEELRIASAIQRRFNSTQILTIYLNRVYLGRGVYGAAAGSKYYFKKHPSELSLAQAAMLAGLIRSPNRYSPNLHPQQALERRNLVIDAMSANRAVPPEYAREAKASGLDTF